MYSWVQRKLMDMKLHGSVGFNNFDRLERLVGRGINFDRFERLVGRGINLDRFGGRLAWRENNYFGEVRGSKRKFPEFRIRTLTSLPKVLSRILISIRISILISIRISILISILIN